MPADVPALVWWMLLAVLAVSGGLARLVMWLVGQRVARIEEDSAHAATQAAAAVASLEARLRAVENGTQLRGIEATLADVRERLVRIETQLEKRP